jgi:hypothetical protein
MSENRAAPLAAFERATTTETDDLEGPAHAPHGLMLALSAL